MAKEKLQQLSVEELEGELQALRREQFNLRMQSGSGQNPRPHQFSQARVKVARIKTRLHQLQHGGSR